MVKSAKGEMTQFGRIPEDWIYSTWGETLAGFSSGATPYRAIPSYYNGKIKWVSSGELNYNTIFDTIEHISEIAKEKASLTLHPANTFLMAITGLEAEGTRGSCALLGVPATTNQSCMAIYGTEKLIVGYIFHFYRYFGDQLAFKYCQGTKQQSYTAKIVKQLPIVFPLNKVEQTAIAETLSDMDNMIVSLEKLIAKKKAMKQGAMQELLTGKRRLTGFDGKWVEKPISYYGSFISGNAFPVIHQGLQSGDYPFYKVSDFNNIGNKLYMDRANNYIFERVANDLKCNIISKNSIVFAKIGAAIFLERKKYTLRKCCIDNNMMAFSVYLDKCEAKYMWYIFQTIKFGELVAATALPSLNGKQIGAVIRLFPPTIHEQEAISTILSEMDDEIEKFEKKLVKYRLIKQGMMQDLLTGRIRLIKR